MLHLARTITTSAIAVAVAIVPLLPGASGDGELLLKDLTHDDLYFAFEEDADPKKVFQLGPDGSVAIKGKDQSVGYLQTLDEYSDFELTLEWRWMGEPGDAGIMIHGDSDPYKSVWTHGIEIDLKHGDVGDFWLYGARLEVTEAQMSTKSAERDRRKRLLDAERPNVGKENSAKPKHEWSSLRLIARGDTLKVFVNEKLANEATAVSPKSGYIALMAQGSDLEIRELRLKELE